MACPCRRPRGLLGLEQPERRDRDGGVGAGDNDGGARNRGKTRHRGAQKHRLSAAPAYVSILLLAAAGAPVAAAAGAGASHSCVVLSDSSVKCWGENFHGQCGQPDNLARGSNASDMGDSLPAVPLGAFDAAFVESGTDFNCAISTTGGLKCWGRNDHGQLGLGNNLTRGGPDDLLGMGDSLPLVNLGTTAVVRNISLSGSQACAILTGGGLKVRQAVALLDTDVCR